MKVKAHSKATLKLNNATGSDGRAGDAASAKAPDLDRLLTRYTARSPSPCSRDPRASSPPASKPA